MTNNSSGVIIHEQVFGEVCAFGTPVYLGSDGMWRKTDASNTATCTGDVGLGLDTAEILTLGYLENPAWSWVTGSPVYFSQAAGTLTQTKPEGDAVVRVAGYPISATVLHFCPADPVTSQYLIGDLPGVTGDVLLHTGDGYEAVARDTAIPSLQNRVLRIKDSAGNDLEIHQVWIPRFRSAGFSQPNLNGILCGGFWVDKFQACQPAASNVSRGGLSANSPGTGAGASCLPHVVPWTDVSWNTAKTVLENRGGAANKQGGSCAVFGSATNGKAEFLVASTGHLIGRHIEIVQGGTTYYRRIIKQGIADEAKYVKVYPDLPAAITSADTYTIIGHHMITPYEWFSLAAWAMTFRYRLGLGYPMGNNDWGKDIGDARSVETEGLADPVKSGYSNHEKARCLTGSGPLSWSLNGREDGVWDLNGNAWEWEMQQVVTDGSAMTLAPGFPGAGTDITPPGSSGQQVTAMYDADTPVDGLSLNSDVCVPTGQSSGGSGEYGHDGYWFNLSANTYAALRGGYWSLGLLFGLWALNLRLTPTYTGCYFGFRGSS